MGCLTKMVTYKFCSPDKKCHLMTIWFKKTPENNASRWMEKYLELVSLKKKLCVLLSGNSKAGAPRIWHEAR